MAGAIYAINHALYVIILIEVSMGEQKRRTTLYMKTTRTKVVNCLNCGASLDAATAAFHDKEPYPGAVAICFMCNHIQIYDDNLNFRELNDDEIRDIAGNEEILELIRASGNARAEVAVRKEVHDIIDAKLKELEPRIACILNSPVPDMMFCATDTHIPGHAGYGADPKEALRALLRSFAAETLKHATERYHQRKRPS